MVSHVVTEKPFIKPSAQTTSLVRLLADSDRPTGSDSKASKSKKTKSEHKFGKGQKHKSDKSKGSSKSVQPISVPVDQDSGQGTPHATSQPSGSDGATG